MTKQSLKILLVPTLLFLTSAAALAQTSPAPPAPPASPAQPAPPASPVPPAPPNPRSVKYKPVADYHQHLFSPDMAVFQKIQSITAKDVIALLDAAGIKRGVLLSVAYSYGRPGREPQDEYAKVKAENDWNSAQAALYPQRLRAFCSFNPLKDYAVEELIRCSKDPNLRYGIKLHFGNSDVQLANPEHLEKVKKVFREANVRRMAIVVHMRASISLDRPYGPEQARIFLDLLSLTPDIPVQVAHLAASGPGYNDPKAQSVLEVLADACAKRDPRTKNLWFDVTSVARTTNSPEMSALLVTRIRQIGAKKILYGTDAAVGGNLSPRDSWDAFCQLQLTDAEIKTIANNVAPHLR
jgi:predicted TIM-barrel fold metal-dependent hydrolase